MRKNHPHAVYCSNHLLLPSPSLSLSLPTRASLCLPTASVASPHLAATAPAGWTAGDGPPVSRPCCVSRSISCCSLSISMMRGTQRIKNVVPATHAALPVLHNSFWLTKLPVDSSCFSRANREESCKHDGRFREGTAMEGDNHRDPELI